jgi:predicted esterase
LFAQETGSFNATVQFGGESRLLACYVPSDYDENIHYDVIIGLHGAGDNAQNFRDVLHTQANWQTIFPETIFIYPDGGNDQSRDFYTPEGDEQIIQLAIDYLKDNYSVNNECIMMTGFSLGARSALKFGLDNPDTFKGMFLNATALQSILDAKNTPNYSLMYNLDNAKKLPIFLSVGADDIAFAAFNRVMFDELRKNNGIVWMNVIDGMAHNIAPNQYTQAFVAMIKKPYFHDLTVELERIQNPTNTCNESYNQKFYLRSMSQDDITALRFDVTLNGATTQVGWNGELKPYDRLEIELPRRTMANGRNNMTISLVSVNAVSENIEIMNNDQESVIFYYPTGYPLPFKETFENDSQTLGLWTTDFSGNVFTWGIDNTVAKEGSNSMSNFNQPLYYSNIDIEETLMTPPMDLTQTPDPKFYFDLAFNYLIYGPPVVQSPMEFSDELIISISTDCGDSFQEIYKKSGADLATAGEPIFN